MMMDDDDSDDDGDGGDDGYGDALVMFWLCVGDECSCAGDL